ncbi:hypothetical protein IV203_020671 [Nitzschia inconspicua]|uniref:Uncharacterized protein n=1 Tax=Nitzschia inconspicua TaxID=303405 RepID=A0A9K3KFV0_9STRA|nr:hypothetical protein IV203_020671 [Nitzschia inconspicua]
MSMAPPMDETICDDNSDGQTRTAVRRRSEIPKLGPEPILLSRKIESNAGLRPNNIIDGSVRHTNSPGLAQATCFCHNPEWLIVTKYSKGFNKPSVAPPQ